VLAKGQGEPKDEFGASLTETCEIITIAETMPHNPSLRISVEHIALAATIARSSRANEDTSQQSSESAICASTSHRSTGIV
jgi:hypothetical protein